MSADAPLTMVVDDDPSVRKSLVRLIRSAGHEVLAFASAREFLEWTPPDRPCCVVLDVRMPGLGGLALQEALTSAGRRLSIVFLSGYRDVDVGVRAMKGGAVDFLTKPVPGRDLLEAIDRALAKSRQTRREEARTADVHCRIRTLTPREAQVFALVVTGMLNKQVAAELGVSEKMVKVHRGRVMEKMRAGSLAELVWLADEARVVAVRA